MKLKLLALVTIVATVTALPAPETATNTYQKRVVTNCTAATEGDECEDSFEGREFGGLCQKAVVSLICR